MNILLDLTDDEITELMNKLNARPVSKTLFKKFEQAVEDGIDGLFNWIEIPEDLNDIPDGVTFGKFNNEAWVGATHYFKSIESGE